MPVPPGLDSNLIELVSGGSTGGETWRPLPREKLFTNVFVWDKRKQAILLGMKKRGFGVGIYNGFGGKVEPGETPIVAAQRELQEEACISASLEPCGILLFVLEGLDFAYKIYVFKAHEYEGEPAETEEMAPEWFSIPPSLLPASEVNANGSPSPTEFPPIPFEKMWADDEFWFPLLLEGTFFVGRADFGKATVEGEASVFERWWFGKKP